MVTSAHEVATRIGVDILKQGGNAIDASVAVAYALAVVYPIAGNIGGGGFATIRLRDGSNSFIDFRESAPMLAHGSMYLDASGQVVYKKSRRGMLAAAVPGTVAGLEMLREKYGTMNRSMLMNPAIDLASKGFRLTQSDADALRLVFHGFEYNEAFKKIFFPQSKPLLKGQKLVQSDLAQSLRIVRDQGVKGFYEGVFAQRLIKAIRSEAGIFQMNDLSLYRVREFKPVECEYRGYHVISAPPPSSGGLVMCEVFNILQGFDLAALGPESPESIHFMIEAFRKAYFDRNNELGDPDFVNNPIDKFLNQEYAQTIREKINRRKAIPSLDWGSISNQHEGVNTTHVSIVDRLGNAVSLTYTLNEKFGAQSVAKGTGILLNNEMDDFTVKVGEPNGFDLVQGRPNSIEPGKRPLSSMSPTIVTHGDDLFLVLGTPGGSKIISTVIQVLVNVIDYKMDLQAAVERPRFHHQWLPDDVTYEPNAISKENRNTLQSWGHVFKAIDPVNHVDAIMVSKPLNDKVPGFMEGVIGVNDSRGNTGLALGE